MCGRYTLVTPPEELTLAFPFIEIDVPVEPRYNAAPTQDMAVVPNDGQNRMRLYRWGLVPHFASDPSIGNRMINARAETVAEKPSFRRAFRRQRCLVLADSFYEWRREPGSKTKTPMRVLLRSGAPFAFAGLFETWRPRGSEEDPLHTFTIITTEANELIEPIHNRMPAILGADDIGRWIEPGEKDPAELEGLLRSYPAEEMRAHPVSRHVNNPRNDDAACIAEIEPPGE